MPSYNVDIPGQGTFKVDSPTDLSDEQAYAAVMEQMKSAPKADESWDITRGFKAYMPQTQETFGGAQAVLGLGAEKLFGKDSGMAKYLIEHGLENIKAGQEKQKPLAKETDTFTNAWEQGIGSVLTDWLPYQIGQGAANILETGAVALGGAAVGSAVPVAGTAGGALSGIIGKSLIKKGVKEAAEKILKEKGEDAAQAYIAKEAKKQIGLNLGLATQAGYHGFGEVGSRAIEEAQAKGKDIHELNLSEIYPAALVHSAADFVSERIGLGALDGLAKPTKNMLMNVGKSVLFTGAKEVPPELLQSAAERYGSSLPLADKEAIDEYINTAAASFGMSVVPGTVGGLRSQRAAPPAPELKAPEGFVPTGMPPEATGIAPAAPEAPQYAATPIEDLMARRSERLAQAEQDRQDALMAERAARKVETTPPEEVAQRLEAASLEGTGQVSSLEQAAAEGQRRQAAAQAATQIQAAPEEIHAAINTALQSVEQNNGVATPAQAQLLDQFFVGQKMYDSIEGQPAAKPVFSQPEQTAIDFISAVDQGGIPLSPKKVRTIAEDLGLDVKKSAKPEATIERIREAVGRIQEQAAPSPIIAEEQRAPREAFRFGETEQEVLNREGFERLAANRDQQQREAAAVEPVVEEQKTPSPEVVAEAMNTPAFQQTPEQRLIVQAAQKAYTPEQMSALQTPPFMRSAEQKISVQGLTTKAQGQIDAAVDQANAGNPDAKYSLNQMGAAYTPEAQQYAAKIQSELAPAMRRFGLHNVALKLVDSINNGAADGAYFRNIIQIALDSENPMATLRHEVIHALKKTGAFTQEEWNLLEKKAREQWINEYFSPEMQQAYLEQYLADNNNSAEGFEAYMAEEAIAEAFKHFEQTGKAPAGRPGNIFRRIKEFFKAIKEFFNARGLTTNDIFQGIERGEYAPAYGGAEVAPAYQARPAKYSLRELPKVSGLENAFAKAREGSFNTNRDLKVFLQDMVKKAAAGKDLEGAKEYLTDVGTADALYAIQSNANAVGWYDTTVTKAMNILATLHPEIATDPDAKFAFTWALAVTSNGLKVDKNFELAEKAYQQYKRTGKMPTNLKAGKAQKAINESMQLFNQMVNRYGIDDVRKFMDEKFKVNQIERVTGVDVGGEFKDTEVRGAAILGPKIGNGFFSNLNGFFDQLTMDRWLMRTWGRWTGSLISPRPDMVKQKSDELVSLVKEIKKNPVATAEFEKALGAKLLVGDPKSLAFAIEKASMKPANREEFNKTAVGEKIRKAGNSLAGYLDGQKEAPAGPSERNFIREVFGDILENVRSQGYEDLTMSDLQALLWYPEKRLYDIAKSSEATEGYEDDEAPDYANAAAKLARDNGVQEQEIQNAANIGTAGIQRTAGIQGVQAGTQVGARGFTPRERKSFLTQGVVRSYRERNGSTSGAYKRKSGSDGRGIRVLGQNAVAEFSPESKFKNALSIVNLPAPKMYELGPEGAAAFSNAITASKNSTPFGAAVYVYPEEDYANMRLFLSNDGKSGFALKGNDIVSVFSGERGAATAMLQLAIDQGGRKLDAFDTVLPDLYAANGFKVVSRLPWNEEFKPEDWNKKTFAEFNGGMPDVVFMAYDPAHAKPSGGEYAADYDQAVAMQDSALLKEKGKPSAKQTAETKYSLRPEASDVERSKRDREVSAAAGSTVQYGTAQLGSTQVNGVHYSRQPRENLDGRFHGTGLSGAERRRLQFADDPRIKRRINFYVDNGSGILPEVGVGSYPHSVSLNNIYDANERKDLQRLVDPSLKGGDWANAFESEVIKAGYDGYVADFGNQRAAVLLGDHVVPMGESKKYSLRQAEKLIEPVQRSANFKRWFGNSKIVDENGKPKVMYHGTARDITEFKPKQAGAIFVTSDPSFAEDFTEASIDYMAAEYFYSLPKSEQDKMVNDAVKSLVKEGSITRDAGKKMLEGFKSPLSYKNPYETLRQIINPIIREKLTTGQNIMPVYVRAENPFDYENPKHLQRVGMQMAWDAQERGGDANPIAWAEQFEKRAANGNWEEIERGAVQEAIRNAGFDSFYISEGGRKNLGVYQPNQVKSASANIGTYGDTGDIRYSKRVLNNTKLTDDEATGGKAIKQTLDNVYSAMKSSDWRTEQRVKFVDASAGLTAKINSLTQMDADGKLRADYLVRARMQNINLIRNGMQSGIPTLNTDGTIVIDQSENNLNRAQIVADQLDTNPICVEQGMSGRLLVGEVARALRGKDIMKEDEAIREEGRRMVAAAAVDMERAAQMKEEAHKLAKEGKQAKAFKTMAKAKKLEKEARLQASEGRAQQKINREKLVTPEQIAYAEHLYNTIPQVREVLDIWKEVNHGLVRLWKDVGLLDESTAAKYLAKDHYVPLFKSSEDLDENAVFGFRGGVGAKSTPKMKRLEGGEHIANIWENVNKQYAKMTALAYENQTRAAAAEQLAAVGSAFEVNKTDPRANLRYRRDGKEISVYAEDELSVAAFQSMSYQMGPIMKAFGATTKALRWGALLNPMFWVKQLIRDPIHASMVTDTMVTPLHATKEFVNLIFGRDREVVNILSAHGVIGEYGNTMNIHEYLDSVGKESNRRPGMIGKAINKLMHVHEASDAATRVAIYKQAYKKAIADGVSHERARDTAVFKARESINFAVQGNSPVMANLRQMIPFLSAQITSLDTVYRAMTGHGLNPAEASAARRIFASRAMMMTACTIAYAMMYAGDKDYDEVPDYEKDGNWLIPIPSSTDPNKKSFITVPVPFELGFLFKTMPEAFIRYLNNDSTGKEMLASYKAGLIHNMPANLNPLPQAVNPILEVITNHSFFTGRPIEGMGDQGKPVAMRGARATETAKMLSNMGLDKIGLSPANLDHLANGYFAQLGGFAMGLGDAVINGVTGKEPPSRNLEDAPFLRAFMTDPTVNRSIATFYDLQSNATQAYTEFNELKKTGNAQEIHEFLTDPDKKQALIARAPLAKISDQMTKLNNEIKRIQDATNITADQKRDLINKYKSIKADLARQGVAVAEKLGLHQ